MSEDNTRPLGAWLRQRREELDISLEQAETDTRIRTQYLEALESEDFEALPDPVVGRGFLRNYASYLELDAKEASERYSEIVAPPEPESLPEETSPFTGPMRPMSLHEMPGQSSRRGLLYGLLAVLLLAALAILAWWAYPWVSEFLPQFQPAATTAASAPTKAATSAALSTATYTPTATKMATAVTETAVAETLVPRTTTPTLTPTLEPTLTPSLTPSPSPSPSPPIYTGIFMELFFLDASWVQVTVDGVRQFQGELEAGTYRSWYGEERIELRLGNAGGVEVTVNGQKLGFLGEEGEVIDRVFEKVDEEVIEATVTSSPTTDLTAEPTEEATAQPTLAPPTPTLTATITPTMTITPTASP